MGLKGNLGPEMTCARCGRAFWPRVVGYWFLLLSPRGRGRIPGSREVRVVLCSSCGRGTVGALESNGILPAGTVERGGGEGDERRARAGAEAAFQRGVVFD